MNRSEIKVIANYLPQFHQIPENDLFWGEGYTDWVAVRKAKPIINNQVQPRVPLNNNYYDLSRPDVLRWQAELAREHGVWGFGIYHYWFSSKQHLLGKPAENLLHNSDIDIGFVLIWDNVSWKRTWSAVKGNDWAPQFDREESKEERIASNGEEGVLARLEYGNREEWKRHFDYLLPFFKDQRCLTIDGKPVFAIMNPRKEYSLLQQMFEYWNELAITEGLKGICPLSRARYDRAFFEYQFEYHPTLINNYHDLFYMGLGELLNRIHPHLRRLNYDRAWKCVLGAAKRCKNEKTFFSGFVGYDDTPRRANIARVFTGQTPEKFEKYMSKLIDYSAEQEKELVFLTAWNEWGEGAYLEPDEQNGYSYLDALKSAINKKG